MYIHGISLPLFHIGYLNLLHHRKLTLLTELLKFMVLFQRNPMDLGTLVCQSPEGASNSQYWQNPWYMKPC